MNNAQLNNANNVPTFSNILNNQVIIQSHTSINENGRLQSYCGLKLINILSPEIGKNQASSFLAIFIIWFTIILKYFDSGEASQPIVTHTSEWQETPYYISNSQPTTSAIRTTGIKFIKLGVYCPYQKIMYS